MPSGGPRPRAARTHVARLVVLAALFAGFAIAFGVHCAEMTPGGMGGTALVAPDMPGTHMVDVDAPGHDSDTDGLLMTCLVFLAAVVAAVAGLRPPPQRLTPVARPSPRRATIAHVFARGPRLVDLCISRT